MCGQGFMMGPGLGKNMADLIMNGRPEIQKPIFDTLGYYRDYNRAEKEALR